MKMKNNTKNIFAAAIVLLASMSSYAAHKSCVGDYYSDACAGTEGECWIYYNPRYVCKVGNNTDCDQVGAEVRGFKRQGECKGQGTSTIFTKCVQITPLVEEGMDFNAKC